MPEPIDVAAYRRDCDETEREAAESQSPTSRVVVPVLTSHLRALLDDKERADHAAGVLNRVWDALGGEVDGEFDQKDIVDLATSAHDVTEAARLAKQTMAKDAEDNHWNAALYYHEDFQALWDALARPQGSEGQPGEEGQRQREVAALRNALKRTLAILDEKLPAGGYRIEEAELSEFRALVAASGGERDG